MLSASASSAKLLQRLATTSLKSRTLAARTFRLPPTSSAFAARASTATVIRSFSSSRSAFQTPLDATAAPTSSEESVKADSPAVEDPLAATSTDASTSSSTPTPETAVEAPTDAEEGVRADQSAVDPLVEASEPPVEHSVFVGGLSWNVDNEWLQAELLKALEVEEGVESVRIARKPDGRSKGFGFVTFANADLAARACTLELPIDNRVSQFRPAEAKKTYPPRARERETGGERPRNPPSNTLWLGNLSYAIDDSALGEVFEAYGNVVRVSIPMDRETGYPRGIAYVEYESTDAAEKALKTIEEAGGMELEGRQVRLDYSVQKPRTFGGDRAAGRGGFGGRGGRGGSRDGGRGEDRRGPPRERY